MLTEQHDFQFLRIMLALPKPHLFSHFRWLCNKTAKIRELWLMCIEIKHVEKYLLSFSQSDHFENQNIFCNWGFLLLPLAFAKYVYNIDRLWWAE